MKFTLVLVFLICSFLSFSQEIDNTFRMNERNLYYQGLKEYIKFSESKDKKIDTLYLEDDYKITDSLLSVCGNTKIIKLNTQYLNKIIYKRKSVVLYRLYPLKYDSGHF